MQNNNAAQNHGPEQVGWSHIMLLNAPSPDNTTINSSKKGVTLGRSSGVIDYLKGVESDFDDGPSWTGAPLTAQLGFPLEALASPNSKTDMINFAVNSFFSVADPTSPDYLSDIICFRGDMMLARPDGKAIHLFHVAALSAYVGETRNNWLLKAQGMEEGEAKEAAKQQVVAKLTPEAFHAYYENYRRQRMVVGEALPFVKVVSPVTLTLGEVEPACGACYAKAEPGKHLLACAKCKRRYYCGRPCQKEEWKEHKKVCGIE